MPADDMTPSAGNAGRRAEDTRPHAGDAPLPVDDDQRRKRSSLFGIHCVAPGLSYVRGMLPRAHCEQSLPSHSLLPQLCFTGRPFFAPAGVFTSHSLAPAAVSSPSETFFAAAAVSAPVDRCLLSNVLTAFAFGCPLLSAVRRAGSFFAAATRDCCAEVGATCSAFANACSLRLGAA